MDHAAVIEKLGGPTALARSLGLVPVNTTIHWKSRGIPARYWHRVAALALQKNLPLTVDDLARSASEAPVA